MIFKPRFTWMSGIAHFGYIFLVLQRQNNGKLLSIFMHLDENNPFHVSLRILPYQTKTAVLFEIVFQLLLITIPADE